MQPDENAEQALSPQALASLVPDLTSPKGQKLVQGLIQKANGSKPELDNTFKLIAQTAGLDPNKDFESRVKQPDTLVKKVASHRNSGEDGYRANDVNDLYGARFIADTPDQKKAIIGAIKDLDENNWLKIDKTDDVHHDTYSAYHIDFNKNGIKGEIQVHDPHSLLESVANHEVRAQYGENPEGPILTGKKLQTQIAYKMPADQAQNMAQQIEQARRMIGR